MNSILIKKSLYYYSSQRHKLKVQPKKINMQIRKQMGPNIREHLFVQVEVSNQGHPTTVFCFREAKILPRIF